MLNSYLAIVFIASLLANGWLLYLIHDRERRLVFLRRQLKYYWDASVPIKETPLVKGIVQEPVLPTEKRRGPEGE